MKIGRTCPKFDKNNLCVACYEDDTHLILATGHVVTPTAGSEGRIIGNLLTT